MSVSCLRVVILGLDFFIRVHLKTDRDGRKSVSNSTRGKKKKKGFARAKKNCTQKMRKLFAASPMCHNTALL